MQFPTIISQFLSSTLTLVGFSIPLLVLIGIGYLIKRVAQRHQSVDPMATAPSQPKRHVFGWVLVIGGLIPTGWLLISEFNYYSQARGLEGLGAGLEIFAIPIFFFPIAGFVGFLLDTLIQNWEVRKKATFVVLLGAALIFGVMATKDLGDYYSRKKAAAAQTKLVEQAFILDDCDVITSCPEWITCVQQKFTRASFVSSCEQQAARHHCPAFSGCQALQAKLPVIPSANSNVSQPTGSFGQCSSSYDATSWFTCVRVVMVPPSGPEISISSLDALLTECLTTPDPLISPDVADANCLYAYAAAAGERGDPATCTQVPSTFADTSKAPSAVRACLFNMCVGKNVSNPLCVQQNTNR